MRLSSQGLAVPSPPHSALGCCVLAVYISSFPRLRLMCVWHYHRGKNWSDKNQSPIFVLYRYSVLKNPHQNSKQSTSCCKQEWWFFFFFFLQNSVFIEESWPQPFPRALMAPCQPSLQIQKSVVRSPVSHQKRETWHCCYVHVVSRSTPSDMEGFGVFKSNSSLEKSRKPLQHYCVILLFPRLKELALSS